MALISFPFSYIILHFEFCCQYCWTAIFSRRSHPRVLILFGRTPLRGGCSVQLKGWGKVLVRVLWLYPSQPFRVMGFPICASEEAVVYFILDQKPQAGFSWAGCVLFPSTTVLFFKHRTDQVAMANTHLWVCIKFCCKIMIIKLIFFFFLKALEWVFSDCLYLKAALW